MSVKAPTLMPGRHVRESVGGLEGVSPPDVSHLFTGRDVRALVWGALHGQARDTRHVHPLDDPGCDILVCWYGQLGVKQTVVQRADTTL